MYTLLRVKNELCDSWFLNTNLGNVNTHYIPSEGILTYYTDFTKGFVDFPYLAIKN